MTSSTNNQASWLGDGWSYAPGSIVRSFASCGQNPAGPTKTGDTCWSANNTLTLSLNGQNTLLVYDDATHTYHPRSDVNERIQDLSGAVNGARNGEYFVVTTDDGTQYYFGLNQLPGYATGDQATNSVWTEPVYATSPGQPCYNATFAHSWCQQAYQWNLDYVKDTHHDVVSYFYATESNSYAADQGSTATVSYVRGGRLTKIQYGQRDGAVYTTQPAGQVVFTSAGRCDQSSCDPATLSTSTASHWPDVPYDLNCAMGAACQSWSPSFWSEYTLSGIETYALVGSTETPVDSWSLTHSFPATGEPPAKPPYQNTAPSLWLASITHTGLDTTAGGSSSPITLPPVTFTPTPLANRVDYTDGYPPITRQRLTQITTETGEIIDIAYSQPACGQATPADPSQNTALCYPSYWTPAGQLDPILDWFNKYRVTEVTVQDPTGGGSDDTIQTSYTPVGSPAWHYDDNPLTPTNQRTWNDWRGYPGMTVTTGNGTDPQTKTTYTYFRGMNGDTTSGGGTATATVTDSRGGPTPDLDQYEGMTYETVVYNGSSVVTDTITDPWTSPATATHAVTGLPAEQAFLTGTADTRVYTPLANGSTRETETSNTYDSYGRVTQVNDQGDLSTTTDDLCTTTSYDDNTSSWILDAPSRVTTVSVNCATTPSYPADAVSDTLTYYDNATTATTPPTVGDPTTVLKAVSYTGSTPNYVTTTSTVDEYGRVTTATDPDNRTTTTAYTPATGAAPTATTTTDPLGHVATTTDDPLRGLPVQATDPAGLVTGEQYDALGRLTSVSKPGVSSPALKYSYTVANNAPSVVDSYTLDPDGSYRLSETLYDAMLRARETQTQTPDNGRDITDTVYNSDGWVAKTTSPYFNASPVAATYVQAQDGTIPSETGFTYDGDGRKTAAIAYTNGTTTETPTWQTSYAYGGDYTTTIPPAGATATTTITDARGRTTDLLQYHTGVPANPSDPASDYTDTRYTYTPASKLASVIDAAGNTWSYDHDLLGRQTTAHDPDVGTTTSSYDPAGQLISTTDARGKQLTTQYDSDGRTTGLYDTTGGATPSSGDKLTAWTYDTTIIGNGPHKAIGYPTTTISYNGGDTYTHTIRQYNAQGQVSDTVDYLTGEDAALVPASGWNVGYGYTTTGYPTSENDNPIDGLPAENITTGYDPLGEPTSLATSVTNALVTAVGYTELGQPTQYTFATNPYGMYLDLGYDPQTQALTTVTTTEAGQPASTATQDQLTYHYTGTGVSAGAGLVTSLVDAQDANATIDTQCFTYDYAERLAQAWTAADACAATPAPGNAATVGGPQPYWQSWTYDPAGDRATQTDHDPAGTTTNDTTTTYHYPTPGSATDQPHTLTNTTATGPQAAADTASFGYNTAGDTTSITTGTGGTGNQTLTYNDQGQLAGDVTTTGNTTYVYDATGGLLVRRDPGTTTLFLGDAQLTENTATGAVSGTRYYRIGTTPIAARTGTSDPHILIPDRQGSDQLAINTSDDTLTRRHYLPFGAPRGTPPVSWPGGDTGYIGGTPDPATQLENLGAREYDPTTGRFLTPDPILDTTSPTQLGGYDYAGNNPTTSSDPTGLHDPDADGTPGLANCEQTGSPTACGEATTAEGQQRQRHIDETTKPYYHKLGVVTIEAPNEDAFWKQYFQLQAERAAEGRQWAYESCTSVGSSFGGNGEGDGITSGVCGGARVDDLETFAIQMCSQPGMSCGPHLPALAADLQAGDGMILGVGGDGAAIAAANRGGEDDQQAAASPCGNSFTGDTPVLMADGTTKPISKVKVGDKITNAEPDNPTTHTDTVTAIHITLSDRDFDQLTITTPTGPHTITSTAHHLYWNTTTHTWTPANNLNTGDQLDTPDNHHATILATTHYTATYTTYNLTINHTHTYYITAGTTPILVHNAGPGCGITPHVTEDGLNHSFDRHATQWFGGQPTRAGSMKEWEALIKRTSQSTQVVPWSSGSTDTYAYLSRIDGKWFAAQFDRTTGDLVTAFVPSNGQLGAMLSLLGK